MNEIRIIGTSHIARQSIEEVNAAIFDFRPDIVAVELDYPRYHALMSGAKRGISLKEIKYIGIKGFLFALIGEYVEKKLGRIVNTKPGADMLAAIKTAKKQGIPIALIDQNISVTLRNFSRALNWREKWRIFADIVKGFLFGKMEMKKMGFESMDLSKVPEKELVKKVMAVAKKRYPSLYRVLVTDRNIYMARMLAGIARKNPEKKILAVVGAGHAEDMGKLLNSQANKSL
jgi:pheromone shutdown-related protein TraB